MTQLHVFDTYAKTTQGRLMHFDVILDEKNTDKALRYAKEWLVSVGFQDAIVTQDNCLFCHSVETSPEWQKQIDQQGYAIYKMEGCPT